MSDNGSMGNVSSPGGSVGSSPPEQRTSVASGPSPATEPGVSNRARAKALDVAREARPWREDQSWWVVGIEGLVVLLAGLYAIVQPEGAANVIRQLVAVVLLLISAGRIVEGFRFPAAAAAPWSTLRGGIGATVALLTLLSPLSQFIQSEGSRQILGLGLLVYGALGVIAAFAVSGQRRFQWGALAGDALAIVLGLIMLTRQPGETVNVQLISWVLIAGGAALLVLAFLIWQRARGEN